MPIEEIDEPKGPLRNFNFPKSADDELLRLKKLTGKDMTKVLSDLLLGRRQFSEDVEDFLSDECARTGKKRGQIIEACIRHEMTGESRILMRQVPIEPQPPGINSEQPSDEVKLGERAAGYGAKPRKLKP